MVGTLSFFARWLGGTAAACAIIAMLAGLSQWSWLAAAASVLAVAVVPILAARWRPAVGAWLGISIASALPLGLGFAAANDVVLREQLRFCGTGYVSMLMMIPFVQLIVTGVTLGLGSMRQSIARLWGPVEAGALLLLVGLLSLGTVRGITHGGRPTAASVLQRAPSRQLEVPAWYDGEVAIGHGLHLGCQGDPCLLGLRPDDRHRGGHFNLPRPKPGDRRIVVYTLPRGVAVAFGAEPYEAVLLDPSERAPANLYVADVAASHGPGWPLLIFGWLCLVVVAVSRRVAVGSLLVWRRLGARSGHSEALPDLIALRIAHLAAIGVATAGLAGAGMLGLLG